MSARSGRNSERRTATQDIRALAGQPHPARCVGGAMGDRRPRTACACLNFALHGPYQRADERCLEGTCSLKRSPLKHVHLFHFVRSAEHPCVSGPSRSLTDARTSDSPAPHVAPRPRRATSSATNPNAVTPSPPHVFGYRGVLGHTSPLAPTEDQRTDRHRQVPTCAGLASWKNGRSGRI